jgi:hypothetical protein
MQEIKPPKEFPKDNKIKIFAAGSIEMGKSEDWQTKLCKELTDYDVNVLNPRRDFWNEKWEQRISDPNFKQQVTWELNGLDIADIVVVYFDPTTKSPISLLELGLHAKDKKLMVCCPDGFWRKGNVEIICDRFQIPLFNTFDELVINLKNALDKL